MRLLVLLLLSLAALPSAWADKPSPLGVDGPMRPSPRGHRVADSGSGFVVATGRLLTNAHVVQRCGAILARNAAGRTARAKLLAQDEVHDLALLGVPRDFGPALPFRDGPVVLRGETVVTYGFPLTGLLSSGPTLTTGSISALSGLRDSPLDFTISAPVQPGNSGGPLLDAQGHVIGVIVAKLNAAAVARLTGGDIPQNVNFAIKGDAALAFLHGERLRPITAVSLGPELRASAIGEIADPAIAFVRCLR